MELKTQSPPASTQTNGRPGVEGSTSRTSQPVIHHQIVVVGGGAAGISAAAQLLERKRNLDIAIIEPSDKHDYQPGWTLVGGGIAPLATAF